ncbi:MAG: hypothetical protein KTR32_32960 [Granulosicoccus sp.]|nr:hypothetical protein [Granulosicoccus sp.]
MITSLTANCADRAIKSSQTVTPLAARPVASRLSRPALLHVFKRRPSIRNLLKRLAERIKTRRQQKIDRDAFRHMLALNDAMLKDIGVTRDAVRWAAQLPLEENAALLLRETAQGGSRAEYR